jgi:predicted GH43/DUF377 family glycosyl hydrolase
MLERGALGEMDDGAAVSPWVYREGDQWHMFYIGCKLNRNGRAGFPYLTLKAKSRSLAGPWTKQKDVIPFGIKPNTYYSITASAGHIVRHNGEYLMFFSSTTKGKGNPLPGTSGIRRTLGIARTKDLDGQWAVDPSPILPIEEQIENTSLYFEPANQTWFLFTNHIGVKEGTGEYTDAVWVYWSKDLNRWDPNNKAIVIDGKNCSWSRRCIGMPSVIPVGKRLAVFYDAPGGDSISHFDRDIGLAWLDLPLVPPATQQKETP